MAPWQYYSTRPLVPILVHIIPKTRPPSVTSLAEVSDTSTCKAAAVYLFQAIVCFKYQQLSLSEVEKDIASAFQNDDPIDSNRLTPVDRASNQLQQDIFDTSFFDFDTVFQDIISTTPHAAGVKKCIRDNERHCEPTASNSNASTAFLALPFDGEPMLLPIPSLGYTGGSG